MEDTTNNSGQPQQQPTERKAVLQPGQDREDELDFMGAGLFSLGANAFTWVKNLFKPHKVD